VSLAVEVAVDVRCRVGESPLWDVRDACLHWVDISGQAVWRHDPATGRTTRWSTPEPVGCIAPRASGGFIAAMQTGVYAFELGDTLAPRLLAAALHPAPQRFNDGRCDRQGRFWVGSMFPDPAQARRSGRLARLDAGVWSAPLLEDMIVPNGLAFSPDGRTLYASDSHADIATVWAFDYDPGTGRASGQRVFIDKLPAGRPDGAAVDADGCYWICANDGAAVLRYTPAGKLDRRIDLPVAKPSMCAFGGAQLDTLYVTSIRPDGDGALAQPLAGAVFACRPGARGLVEPAYAG
jgi:sugar lactone lactonase YvrE